MVCPVGRAGCSEQDSHQTLQGSLSDIELPGSRMAHVLLKLQVNDGEVDNERQWDRGYCRGDERKTRAQPLLFSLDFSMEQHLCAYSSTGKILPVGSTGILGGGRHHNNFSLIAKDK